MNIPTAVNLKLNAVQIQRANRLDWDLRWPSGWRADPENIVQTVERSQFPNGPFEKLGTVPGPITHFVDIAFDQGTLYQRPYYRVVCRRVIR